MKTKGKVITQLQRARAGETTPEMQEVAKREHLSSEYICSEIASGRIIIPCNINGQFRKTKRLCGIGRGLATKVNANIGTSTDCDDLENEIAKLKVAEEAGADTLMDLSTGLDIPGVRHRILQEASIPLGTVPIYEAAADPIRREKSIHEMKVEDLFRVIREHAENGVDFITVHCGVTMDVLKVLKRSSRVCGIVSRGGTLLAEWMVHRKEENPLYARFDDLLDIARKHDVTLSLGDGLRPGAIADSFDAPQVAELVILSELKNRALEAGVQVMIEGPGHVPIDQVEAQVRLEKEICRGAPFYVLGPLVTDIAPGYDHITSAIGGAIAASAGADFLCYVTASEHLGLPTPELVREGVVATKIAAHAGDIAKRVPGAFERDHEFSELRKKRDWKAQIEKALDPKRAAFVRQACKPQDEKVCSMCGKLCVFKILEEAPI